jgi:hypothetical protein
LLGTAGLLGLLFFIWYRLVAHRDWRTAAICPESVEAFGSVVQKRTNDSRRRAA